MNKRPIVSIIVPVYNVEPYLRRCVESLRNQSLEDLEIILVDDKSTDNSPQICDLLKEEDHRIKVIHKPVNCGLGMARNTGILHATGDYIMFIDSDDTYDTEACKTLYSAALNNNAEISTGCFYKEVTPGKWVKDSEYEGVLENDEIRAYILDMIASKNPSKEERLHQVSVCLLCIKKSLIENLNLKFHSERQVASEDILFKTELLLHCSKIVCLNYPFYHYYINYSSLSHTYNSMSFDNLSILMTHLLRLFPHNDSEAITRIQKFIISDARSNILRLYSSNTNNKIEILKHILSNKLWRQLNDVSALKLLTRPKKIFFNLCASNHLITIHLYIKLIQLYKTSSKIKLTLV